MDKLFCSTALKGNIKALEVTIPRLRRWYDPPKHYIIVPNSQIEDFSRIQSIYNHVEVVAEEDILSIELYERLCDNVLGSRDDYKVFRHKWYFQQILKVLFSLNYKLDNSDLIIWDADTIPLKKLIFTEGERVLLYGSPYEYCYEYYKQIYDLTGVHFSPRYSFITQFCCVTKRTQSEMRAILLNEGSFEDISEQAVRKILSSIGRVSTSLRNSDFSEYELIGYLNSNIYGGRQTKLLFMRWEIQGNLSRLQCLLLKILGFVHISYESQTVSLKDQKWLSFARGLYSNLKTALFIRRKGN